MSFDRAPERVYAHENGSGMLKMVKMVEKEGKWVKNGRKFSKVGGVWLRTRPRVKKRSTVVQDA